MKRSSPPAHTHALCFHPETNFQKESFPSPSDEIYDPAPILGSGFALPPPGISDHHLFLEYVSENFAGKGSKPWKADLEPEA